MENMDLKIEINSYKEKIIHFEGYISGIENSHQMLIDSLMSEPDSITILKQDEN